MSYLRIIQNRSLVDDVAFSGTANSPKPWVATAIGAALGVASSLWGGHKASQAAAKANRMIAAEKAENDAWFRRRYNEHYADTAAGQNLLRQAREYADKNWKRAQGASKVAGATAESAALAKESGNKVVADTLSNVAAQDTARKDRVDAQHRSMNHQLTQQQVGVEQQRAASITNAAQQASNSLIMAGAYYDAAGAAKASGTSAPTWSISASQAGAPNPVVTNPVIGDNNVDDLKRLVGQQ